MNVCLHYAGCPYSQQKDIPLKKPFKQSDKASNTKAPANTDIIEPTVIEKLVSGGYGLARTPQVRLVPFAVPGDQGSLLAQGKTNAKWQTLSQPSPARVEPVCQVFGECGGCQWQMLPVPTQQFWKQAILAENLARIGKLPKPYPLAPVLPGSLTRNQIKCQVLWGKANQLVLQLVAANPHQRVVPDPCHVVPLAVQQIMAAIQQHPWPLTSAPDTLSLRISDNQAVHMVLDGLSTSDDQHKALEKWAATLAQKQPLLQGVHLVTNEDLMTDEEPLTEVDLLTLWGLDHETHTVAGQTFQVGPTCFFQVNDQGAEHLVKTVSAMAGPGTRLLDAYSGVGLFSKLLASRFNHLIAVENHATAHEYALKNAPGHVTCLNQSMEDFITLSDKDSDQNFDVAVVDPPRAGLPPLVADWLAAHIARSIVLVGCDAAAVARDTARLVGQGWQLVCVQPIDMFPHTHHVETVVLLEKA